MAEILSRYFWTGDGTCLHAREAGAGDIVSFFLHGFGDGAFVWDHLFSNFDKKLKCVALDLRGHGESGWDISGNYSIARYVEDFIHILDIYRARNIIVVGHSMGAEIAIRASTAIGVRLKGLVIVDYGLNMGKEGRLRVRSDFEASLRPFVSVSEFLLFLESRRPLSPIEMLRHFATCALKEGEDGKFYVRSDPALLRLKRSGVDSDISKVIEKISCSSLVIRGVGSAILDRNDANNLVNYFKNGVLKEISIAGHAVMLDNPQEFFEVFSSFCENFI